MADWVFPAAIGLLLVAAASVCLRTGRLNEDKSSWLLMAAGLALLAAWPLLPNQGPSLIAGQVFGVAGALAVLVSAMMLRSSRSKLIRHAEQTRYNEQRRMAVSRLRQAALEQSWDDMHRQALSELVRFCAADFAAVYRLDPMGPRLEVLHHQGLAAVPPPQAGFQTDHPSVKSLLAATAPSLLEAPEEGEQDSLADYFKSLGARASVGVSLDPEKKSVVGALSLHSRTRAGFSDAEIDFLAQVRLILLQAARIRQQSQDQARLELIRQETTEIAFCFDPRLYVTFLNQKTRRMIGVEPEEPIHLRLMDLLPGWALDKMASEAIPQAAKSGLWSGETAMVAKNGREIPILQVLLAHRSEGEPLFFTCFGFDLIRSSTRMRTPSYEELCRRIQTLNERLEDSALEVERFAQATGRRLQEPIAAVASFSRSLLQHHGSGLGSEGTRYLRMIAEAAKNAGEVVMRLNHVARLQRQELVFEEVNMAALAKSAFRELTTGNEESIQLLSRTLFPVLGDRRQLKKVYRHLISNAVKFTRGVERPEVEVGSRSENGRYIYYVRDNGIGFDIEDIDRLFQLFQRLHDGNEYEGVGAGLFEVKRIVHRHGGEVWAQGGRESGTTIYFALPARQIQ